jgi:uncharacterized membrane protein
MTALRRYWLALLFAGSAFAIAGLYYGRLPERIPVHWNLYGGADGWMPKRAGAFALPLTALILTGLLIAVAPKKTNESNSGSMPRVYPTIVAAIAAFLFYVTIMVVSVGMGMELSVPSYLSIGLGVLLTVIGNSLGKITRNRIVGIRTPWTLASEEVWFRTHRVGGWLLVLAGFAATVAGLLGRGTAFAVSAVIAAATVLTVYSFVISRRLDRGNPKKQQ